MQYYIQQANGTAIIDNGGKFTYSVLLKEPPLFAPLLLNGKMKKISGHTLSERYGMTELEMAANTLCDSEKKVMWNLCCREYKYG